MRSGLWNLPPRHLVSQPENSILPLRLPSPRSVRTGYCLKVVQVFAFCGNTTIVQRKKRATLRGRVQFRLTVMTTGRGMGVPPPSSATIDTGTPRLHRPLLDETDTEQSDEFDNDARAETINREHDAPVDRHSVAPADDDSSATAWTSESSATDAMASVSPNWHIQQGGLFFLLNLLNSPVVRKRLFADAQAMSFPSGWGWLYRLGQAFGLRPEANIDRCMGSLSGLEEAFTSERLPPLALADEILELGRQRYEPLGVWHPHLLQRKALVDYRRPELDITLRSAELDLDVRRAALDVDPGWIDWLGTRVRFHYRDNV